MGKIRVKTIGIEEDEKDQKKKAKQKAEAKRIEAAKKQGEAEKATQVENSAIKESVNEEKEEQSELKAEETKTEKKAAKTVKTSKYKASKKARPHSESYLAMAKQVDKNKKYSVTDALKILNSTKRTKLDETVELHINTQERGISGNLTLPHGSGKKAKIEIADHAADPKHVEELVKAITGGQVDFDILIATPDTMSHLAKVARVLGPRGLMPNPKNGTIHPKPKEAAKKFELGQINFKTEAKAPIMHLSIGKISFEEKKLVDNVEAVIQAVQAKNIKNITLKSTMSPGIKLNFSA